MAKLLFSLSCCLSEAISEALKKWLPGSSSAFFFAGPFQENLSFSLCKAVRGMADLPLPEAIQLGAETRGQLVPRFLVHSKRLSLTRAMRQRGD